jgi:ATP-dependent DNA helicase RecQ
MPIDSSLPATHTLAVISQAHLLSALRHFWGYDTFLPLQEKIVRSLLDGHDTCAIMPTGGGKSLCYQLPAALLPDRTVVVISPLIALMQDQVAQLDQMGIPAAFLNSSLKGPQQTELIKKACKGSFRLLYLSPERLARADTVDWLKKVPIALFAVDEAHCISQWGHEFRPDYLELSRLRTQFPGKPIAAFTASATQQVRHDIIAQLQLRDPHKYIASFHRRNLRYTVAQCSSEMQHDLLVKALRAHSGESVIVYSPTIRRVGEIVSFLEQNGISALPYHGKMEPRARRTNQERWTSDEVRVLVGTIAFGLGINKAAVRAVIHLSLPKSIEHYYQEAGRAGRDSQPADCVLLWQKRDEGLLAHFIGQISDPEEKERAWQRFNAIKRFVESRVCRHRQICGYFGENLKAASCHACDVCGATPDWFPKAAPAKPPAREVGAAAKAPASSGSRQQPLPQIPAPSQFERELREYLREWRQMVAHEQRVPAFVVMYDTSLEDLCRKQPRSVSELFHVRGFGERKIKSYGQQIVEALNRFRAGARVAAKPNTLPTPARRWAAAAAGGSRRS